MDKDFSQKMIEALKKTAGKSMEEIESSTSKEAVQMLEMRKAILKIADIEIGMSADGREGFVTSARPAKLRADLLGEGLANAFNLEINVRYTGAEVSPDKMRGLVAIQLVEITDLIKDRFAQALEFNKVMMAAEKRMDDKSN
jgi:hypothetical protein